MVAVHEFTIYATQPNTYKKLYEGLIENIVTSNYKININRIEIRNSQNISNLFVGNNIKGFIRWLSTHKDISEIILHTNHNTLPNEFAIIRIYHKNISEQNRYIICQITTQNFALEPKTNEDVINKKRRFDNVLVLIKTLCQIFNAFYCHGYLEELVDDKYIDDIVLHKKARENFDITYWGNEYPMKPNDEILTILNGIGYIVEHSNNGIWLYYPPELWYTKAFFKAQKTAFRLLDVSMDEHKYLLS